MAHATKTSPTTKTFAGRIDATLLETVEAITQRDAGMSFGQYCCQLANNINAHGKLPTIRQPKLTNPAAERWRQAMEEYQDHPGMKKLAQLSDEDVREMVRGRNDL